MNQYRGMCVVYAAALLTFGHLCTAQEGTDIKKTLRIGIECREYFTAKSNSFTIAPGFTVGFMTGIGLHRAQNTSVILGIDANYTRIMAYDHQVNIYRYGNKTYRDEVDTRHQLGFLELGVLPTLSFPISRDFQGSVYAGIHAGIGTRDNMEKVVSAIAIDSTTEAGAYYEPAYPGSYIATAGYSLGAGVYYKRLMIDVRYKYTSMTEESDFHTLYIQLGLVL